MSTSFPCLVCGKALEREFDEFESQPAEGVMCRTRGNYGSRIFDDFAGEALDFNLCDDCLVRAGEQGRVFIVKVELPIRYDGAQIGWQRVSRPHVPWRSGTKPDDAGIDMDFDEMDSLASKDSVHLWITKEDLIASHHDHSDDDRPCDDCLTR